MKVCYLDTETTGVDPAKHALIQVAMIIEIDGEVKQTFSSHIRPISGKHTEPTALEINGITPEQLYAFPQPKKVYGEITKLLAKYVDKFDRSDKFTLAGYNVRFDAEFLRQFFIDNGDKYYGSFFNWCMVDPLPLLHLMRFMGYIDLPDYKLGTVCEHFGIDLGDSAHDAMADIAATRQLIGRLSPCIVSPIPESVDG